MKQYIEREYKDGVLVAERFYKDKRMQKLHRLDGPATFEVDFEDDHCFSWVKDGMLHREDGPASYIVNGSTGLPGGSYACYDEYYLDGTHYSHKSDWEDAVKKLHGTTKESSIEGKFVEIDGVKYKLTKA